ncbi:MAG: tRNA-dihydrouridine synthase family protein [Bacteroidales bacterium]|nr:tRNA-dihydrouridine synthase family protein [Bacteroidales bacterium]
MIYLSPLQGITDYKFRNAYLKYFSDVDKFFSPYIRLSNKKELKKAQIRDILPKNNLGIPIIPQIMVNNSEDFIFLANMLSDYGYDEINWNLGCPYPMVTNRQLGSGLLELPEKIDSILTESLKNISTKVSVKMRLGLNQINEIDKIIPILNNHDLTEIIIHPRTGKQLYKGEIYLDKFIEIAKILSHKIIYNGDITNLDYYKEKIEPITSDIMIGRGLISNPFLASEIKNGKTFSLDEKKQIFREFHNYLLHQVENSLSGDSHVLSKMTNYWEYFSLFFENSRKVFKQIKKAKSLRNYDVTISEIFRTKIIDNFSNN